MYCMTHERIFLPRQQSSWRAQPLRSCLCRRQAGLAEAACGDRAWCVCVHVFMYVCTVCVYVLYVCMYVFMHVWRCVHNTCTPVHTYVGLYVRAYSCMYYAHGVFLCVCIESKLLKQIILAHPGTHNMHITYVYVYITYTHTRTHDMNNHL